MQGRLGQADPGRFKMVYLGSFWFPPGRLSGLVWFALVKLPFSCFLTIGDVVRDLT